MPLFESKIRELRQRLSKHPFRLREADPDRQAWPRNTAKQMILEQDMGAELGNGRLPSFAVVLWSERRDLAGDGSIRVYGPDIPQIAAPGGIRSAPFGKVALLEVEPLPAGDIYAAFERMDAVRFDMNLKGYMLRGFTQRNREWSRVSKSACDEGFSFSALGTELIRDYKKLPFVKRAEMLFLTESALIQELSPLAEDCTGIVQALDTLFENIQMDCKNCDAAAICEDVDELRKLHRQMRAAP
jgi:CO dehydrogenase/acetyl-CoA synthase beta subunit